MLKCRDCGKIGVIHCKGRCRSCANIRKQNRFRNWREFTKFLSKFKLDVFVETGTYGGRGVQSAIDLGFEQIYSMEIYRPLYLLAKRKFRGKPKGVHLLFGDSGSLLSRVLNDIPHSKKITFWLDAHYSGKGTGLGKEPGNNKKEVSPLRRELDAIKAFNRPPHDIILIDDYVHLGTFKYSLDSLKEHLLTINPFFNIEVVGGRVLALPKNEPNHSK